MISVQEAKSIISNNIQPLGFETVSLKNAGNRVLAQDITATFPMPQFDNSSMDGFAVRAVDTEGADVLSPVILKMVGISSAGTPCDVILKSGQCAQCMTGAVIPDGADAIIIVENTSGFLDSETVYIFQEAKIGEHIRRKGEEIQKDEILLSRGICITPNEIGTLASFGYDKISFMKIPKIAIIVTGSELIEPGNKIELGRIYNSNLYMIAELAKKSRVEIVMREVIKDDKDYLCRLLSEALQTCDVIISSGGISMGRFDYMREVYNKLGVQEHFWKVAQKPGKPLFFGTLDSKLIFGLPGNPVSSFICYMEYIYPVLQDMQKKTKDFKQQAILTETFPVDSKKHRYLFGRSWIDSSGRLLCSPTSKTGSHMVTAFLGSNCIMVSPPGKKFMKKGDKITINQLNWRNNERSF